MTHDKEVGQLYNPIHVATASRTARALADMIAFDEIMPELERRAKDNPEIRGHLAAFYAQNANVRIALGDDSEAWSFFDRALDTVMSLDQDGRAVDLIVSIYLTKAFYLETRLGSDQ